MNKKILDSIADQITSFREILKDTKNEIDRLVLYRSLTVGIDNERLVTDRGIQSQHAQINLLQNQINNWIRIEEVALGKTTELVLRAINIIPEILWQLTNLLKLDLSSNSLTNLPHDIGFLTNLVALRLSNNKLEVLPPEIGQLRNLKSLHISHNTLKEIPSEIGNLTYLEMLELSSNRLTDLPFEIGQLINLTELDVSNNEIIAIPRSIEKLINLNHLDISKNKINYFPIEICRLPKLITLNLSSEGLLDRSFGKSRIIEKGNSIDRIPREIFQLRELRYLDLIGNPLPIPPEILEKFDKPQIVLNYYFSVVEQQRKPLNEIKLILVGQGSVGKTSLVQQILHGTFDQNQTKTEGISINQWMVDSQSEISNQKSEIKLNIWDFGGQEIMHATHQFFLTKRSLYLLVLDARLTQEENRVEYWLKIIQSFGGESPVLIVGNKTDQHPLDIDRTGLQKKYSNIVGILETSAATGAGIEELKTAITEYVNNIPHVRDLLPETWFTVKSKLEELGKEKNFITQDEYLGLCDTNDITDETSQHTLIGFLHDLGVVLHFQDDPRLEALGILNPQWVTNGVYKILNSHTLFQNKGVLTLSMLDEILNLPEYPRGKRLFIVDMMKKFELCYDIEPDKTFLVPDLLPKDEIYTGEWNDAV